MDLYATPRIVRTDRADGSMLLSSVDPVPPHPVRVTDWLRTWAAADPDHPLVAERGPDGGWRRRGYGEVLAAANAIGQALLDRGLSARRPLMILSGNSIGHLLTTLGALTVGVPVAPVSEAYSLRSRDHTRIKALAELVRPGAVYVEDASRFGPALAAVGHAHLIAAAGGPPEHSLAALLATAPGARVDAAHSAITAGTVAKILFTSGSTGSPKGVLTTHGMLTANQAMISHAWPFLARERPVLVDWLPWSHTFGGSHNVNLVLAHGGTLYIDDGRPVPELFSRTLANFRDVSPTLSFNVPTGYALLTPALERDRVLAEHFFARLRLIFNAAAALPAALRRRLAAVARDVAGREIPITGAWGTTETAPAATMAHFDHTDARCVGVPLPGVTLKLLPGDAGTYEIRVRGAIVTPGYHRRPDLTAAALDDEGFYRPGDAVTLADPHNPNAGLLFHGRLAEDFKLTTGTFVHVAALRTALLSAAPILADAVITGENRATVGALVWLNPTETARLLGDIPAGGGEVVGGAALHRHLAPILARFNVGAGSAARIERLIVLADPPSLDTGEITDKGYVNQRAVLANRAHLVARLYTNPPPDYVITV